MYYIKVAGRAKDIRKAVAHIWTGDDTLCMMASSGGMDNSTYQLFETTLGKNVCQNCLGVKPRVQIVLDKTQHKPYY